MKARRVEEFCSEFEAKMQSENIDEVIANMCGNYFDDLDDEM